VALQVSDWVGARPPGGRALQVTVAGATMWSSVTVTGAVNVTLPTLVTV